LVAAVRGRSPPAAPRRTGRALSGPGLGRGRVRPVVGAVEDGPLDAGGRGGGSHGAPPRGRRAARVPGVGGGGAGGPVAPWPRARRAEPAPALARGARPGGAGLRGGRD